MNTKYFLASILLLMYQLSFAQTNKSTPITFMKSLTMADNPINRGVTVEPIQGGGYILTGVTSLSRDQGQDIFLIKTNQEGDVLWKKTYGGDGNDNGWAVRQLEDGYVVVGFSDSFGAGDMDIILIKTDLEGTELWRKTYGGTGEEFGWDIQVTNQGFIIAAQSESFGNGEIDAYLIYTDYEGNEKWSKTYGGDKIDRVFSIQETQDGGFITCGITYSFESAHPGDRDGYFFKVDPNGNELWSKVYGNDAYDVIHHVSSLSNGNSLLTGYGESFTKSGKTDVYLVEVDSEGSIVNEISHGFETNERGIKGVQAKDGGFVAIGFAEKNRDLYLVKTSPSGEVKWDRTYGKTNQLEFGYTVEPTPDGGFILIGHSEDLVTGESEILLIKTNEDGLVE